jgi:hypothetical protein
VLGASVAAGSWVATVTCVAGVTGVPQAASTRLASITKLKRGNNNLRMIFFSFERIFCLKNKCRTTLQFDTGTSNLLLKKIRFLLFSVGCHEATLYKKQK